MSSSRKNSNPYSRSSFDAMESTRRLSDGLSGLDPVETRRGHARRDSNLGDVTEPDHDGGSELNERDPQSHNKQYSHDLENHKIKTDDSMSNDETSASCSLGSIAKAKTSDDNNNDDDGINNFIDKEGNVHDMTCNEDSESNQADQRSESDSDLDSPDDFDNNGGPIQYQSFQPMDNSNGISDIGQQHNLRKDILENKQTDPQEFNFTNRIIAKSSLITTADIINPSDVDLKNSKLETDTSHEQCQTYEDEITQKEQQDDDSAEFPKPPRPDNNPDDSYRKIHENSNVLNHIEKLDEVKDISFSNMQKLQHLDRSDPALRRLFLRPRVSPAETKSVKVDPDIKSMVNEFLKTNITDNFIIARVLRENYAMFYAWLASHMQTERNAWAVRMGQAFEKAEAERKGSLECRNLVVEAATRLKTLVTTVSNSLYGVQRDNTDKTQHSFPKGPSLRHGHVKGFSNSKGGGGARMSDNKNHNINSGERWTRNPSDNCYNSDGDTTGSVNGLASMLRQSSFNMIQVSQPDNYESDPGTGKHAHDLRKRLKHFSKNNNYRSVLSHDNGRFSNSYSYSQQSKPEIEAMSFGYSVNGVVVEYDDDTDWNRVLIDSIDVLAEICDTLLTDRQACLKLISSRSSQYESLVDALSNFIQDNQSREFFMRKEIEKRLRVLEVENKNMQEEVNMLKKTLMDKNEDALNLQSHLSRLEAAMKSQKAETKDKCVGTHWEDFVSPRVNLAVGKHGKTVKTKSPRFGVDGDKPKGANSKLNKTHKIIKSPYATQEPPVINGISPRKPPHNAKTDIKNGYASDVSESAVLDNDLKISKEENDTPFGIHRQQSFIEISEEKLEKLKHRAKKLEESLHDAISSMDMLNKSTPWTDRNRNILEKPAPRVHIQKVKAAGNHYQTAKSIAYWKKSSFGITNSISNRQRFVGTVTKSGPDINRRANNAITNDAEFNFRSENSSLLEGRAIADLHLGNESNTVSSLKLVSDRPQGLTPRSNVSRVDGYHSDDEGRSSTRQNLAQHSDLSARSEISHKVRARRGQTKQAVSKCLRCQKLFSPVDNHKLACCYHAKDKERLEHYDHMGMLVKVIYAWKCCNQPQEADGCSFGKHV